MQITASQLKELFPQNDNLDGLANSLNRVLEKYEINTVNRLAGFLAQCGHESAGFTVLKENLNYSAEGLTKTFKKYFPTLAVAQPYARQPEKIANRVYANRMGNGPESSGDGYKFRGRGAIQLTGRSNYTRYASDLDMSIDEVIANLETLDGAIESACWFWKNNGLNSICDKNDIVAMTRIVNGGDNGLEDRKKHYSHAKEILGTVEVKLQNETVKLVQQKLGLVEDGIYGPATRQAVKDWQTAQGLTADGIVGPVTLKKMLG